MYLTKTDLSVIISIIHLGVDKMLKKSDNFIFRLKNRFGSLGFNVALFLGVLLILSTSFTLFARRDFATANPTPSVESEVLDYGYNISFAESQNTAWQSRLYAPTQVTKINGLWFIVDCWHNRVIYSADLFAPISSWKVLDSELAGPHSIAYGNGYYAVEDTNRHKVNFYAFDQANQTFVKKFSQKLGSRPHRIQYVESNKSFYVLSSESQQMDRIEVASGQPILANTQKLAFLDGAYTRSFTIVGDEMLFVSGAKKIVKSTYLGDKYQTIQSYFVPPAFYGMNDIYFTGDKYILTSTLPNAFGVVNTLSDIPTAKNEAEKYGFKGRPYYVSQYGGAIIIPEIAEYNSIKIFKTDDQSGDLMPTATIHEFGEPNEASKAQSSKIPLEHYLN